MKIVIYIALVRSVNMNIINMVSSMFPTQTTWQ